jgi:surfeit locus 1 family protein
MALVALAAFFVAFFAGFAALGTWQIHRLSWKRQLIADVDARLHQPPIPLPSSKEWLRFDVDGSEYRPVQAAGVFLNDRETLVHALTERGAGYWVITPLRTGDGDVVLINRGFVPLDLRDARNRLAGQIEGEVRVTGLLRHGEPGAGFLRSNDPASDRWYFREVAAIAAARGLGVVAPFFVDADATPNAGGYPIGGLTVVTFPNNHLVYAITWYALAAMVAGTGVWAFLNDRRIRDGMPRATPS